MKSTLACKIMSCLSLFLAMIYLYELANCFEDVKELFLEISSTALIVTILVIFNFSLSVLLLSKKIKPKLVISIFQILIILVTAWSLYEIYSFKEMIIDSQTVS